MTATDWQQIILTSDDPASTWQTICDRLRDLAIASSSPVLLHNETIAPDRLLAESAWELWQAFPEAAPNTIEALQAWYDKPSPHGKAVLILDAFTLRELPLLLANGEARDISPTQIHAKAAAVPTDTNCFAKSLGVSTRGNLKNDSASSGFILDDCYTDVVSIPFEDSLGTIPHQPNVFIWHSWLDDLIHVHNKAPDQVTRIAEETFASEGFWKFIDRLRQGRDLLITADHGYATSKQFSSEEFNQDTIDALRKAFGASRYAPASKPWSQAFMPPVVQTINGHHVVVGQRKWTVQGGFPPLCHGGLSLLEAIVPFVELPAL